ncbi:MAG: hypothetical protein JWQ04_657 [Pedosphaera sp.]|nr:hypothetical protein [Pedosphaera sp.]
MIVNTWNTEEAPKDGRPIVAVGRVIWSDDFSTAVDPFCGAVFWDTSDSKHAHWAHWPRTEYGHAMSVARTLDDEVRIDYWMPHPHAEPIAGAQSAAPKVLANGQGEVPTAEAVL